MSTWPTAGAEKRDCLVPAIVCGSWPSVARHSANGCWSLTSEICRRPQSPRVPHPSPNRPNPRPVQSTAIGGRPVSGRLGDADVDERRASGRSLPRRRTAAGASKLCLPARITTPAASLQRQQLGHEGAPDGVDEPLPTRCHSTSCTPAISPVASAPWDHIRSSTSLAGRHGDRAPARSTSPTRIVAVKVLWPDLAANSNARRRFLREAQAAVAASRIRT